MAAAFSSQSCNFTSEVSLENGENSDTWKNHLSHIALCVIYAHEVSLKIAKNSDTWKDGEK